MNIEDILMGYFYEYDAKARALYPTYAALPRPKITFITKGCVNGRAKYGTWEIELNTYVAAQISENFRNTVSHEVAHLVDYSIRHKSGHDRIWKNIHISLGGTGTRCSDYGPTIKVKRARTKTEYLYRNKNGAECWVGPKHHAAMMRGTTTGVRNKAGQTFQRTDWTRQYRKI